MGPRLAARAGPGAADGVAARILPRGCIDPRTSPSAAEVLEQDLITDVRGWWRGAGQIDEEDDAVVLPHALGVGA